MLWLTLFTWVACAERRVPSPAYLGERSLSAEKLAEILVLSQPLPLSSEVASELARQWLHVSVVAQHLAAGDSLNRAELVEEATWLDRRGRWVEAWLRWRRAEPAWEAERMADSVYAGGQLRLLAHVFRRVGAETRPEEKELQRRSAERIRQTITQGGAWAEAVAESEDESTRANNGLLGLVRAGDLVAEFERAAFALQPGELSPVTETRYGFHIIHRPRLSDVRPTFVRLLAEQLAGRSDSLYVDSLRRSLNLSYSRNAATRVRELAREPWDQVRSSDTVATFTGGSLSAGLLGRYLVHLPADARTGISSATDEEVLTFIEPIVFDEMLLQEAATHSFALPDSMAAAIEASYREAMDALVRDAHLDVQSLGSAPAEARADTAAQRVMVYLEAVAARRLPLYPVPPLLAMRLLEGAEAGLNANAIDAAVERARRWVGAAADAGSGKVR
jgi:hypothetical protein